MTYSQLGYFRRAAAYLDVQARLEAIEVEHNPWANEPSALQKKLGLKARTLLGPMGPAAAPSANGKGMLPAEANGGGGVSLRDLERVFGKLKTVTITPEEMRRRRGN